MIDGIKVWCDITNDLERNKVLDSYKLRIKTPAETATGEMEEIFHKTIYKSLTIIVRKAKPRKKDGVMVQSNKWSLTIEGSIHNYFHQSNHTDFTHLEICQALDLLSIEIGIPLNRFKINHLEFGVNVRIELEPSSYYDDFILYRQNKFQKINNQKNSTRKLRGLQCEQANMIIKCYDKGHQKYLNHNLIRFEIKTRDMRYVTNRIGIEGAMTLQDLKDKSIYPVLGETLVKVYEDILKIKEVNLEGLKDKDKELMNLGRYPMYWLTLRKEQGRNKCDSRLKRFKAIQDKYGVEKCKHKELSRLIKAKFLQLIGNNDNTEIDAITGHKTVDSQLQINSNQIALKVA